MKIVKVINNNTVSTVLDSKKEVILTGSGLGFKKRPGDAVDMEKVEKVYQRKDKLFARYEQIHKHIPPGYFQAAEEILTHAQKGLGASLSQQAVFALADHIAFAVERQLHKEPMPNLMLQEVRMLYPDEYQMGMYGKILVEQKTGVELPDDEAGYMALHIVNSKISENSVDAKNILALTGGIVELVKTGFGVNFDEADFNYNRLLTHLKFLAKRILKNESDQLSVMGDMLPAFLERDSRIGPVLEEIREFLLENFEYSITREEMAYLAMYLIRILKL